MTLDEALNLAIQHHQSGELPQAEHLYRQILQAVPDHPPALHLLGVLAHQVGKPDIAVDLITRSLSLQPHPGAYSNLGEVYRQTNRLNDAIAAYRRSIELDPATPTAYSNLGLALRAADRFAEAETPLRNALQLDPNFAPAWQNLCNVLGDLGKTEEAVAAGQKAVSLNPVAPAAWSDLAVACIEHGSAEEARDALEHARVLDPGNAEVRHNYAQVLLRSGKLLEGWDEYESRWKCPNFPSPIRNFPHPLWSGEPLDNQTILLHSEQGFGDALMFARYIPMVAARKPRALIVECQPELLDLLRPLVPTATFLARGQPLPPFDTHAPFLSLPRAFRTTVDSIPSPGPYIHADPAKSAAWRDHLSHISGKRIGLVWAGRPTHKNDHNRSVPLSHFAPLAHPGITFVSLQVGAASSQAATPPPGLNLFDASPDLKSYADTAALIANLDLVIAVDTSVVHLAAAMGKPVWTLLPFAADWRWMDAFPESTPWYPTMRLFRQPRPRDWASVFDRVARELHGSLAANG